MSAPVRVMIVEDHGIVREGLRNLLAEEAGLEVVAEASNGSDALGAALEARPDVVLLDLVMPGMDGVEVIRALRLRHPRLQVVVLTSFADEPRVRGAVAAGAIGYLLKDVLKAELVQAIRNAAGGIPSLHPEAQRRLMDRVSRPSAPGPTELTPRERGVLELVARGQSNRAIAATLGLTEGTVKGYVSAVLAKIGVADRTQAALWAIHQGLVPASDPLARRKD